MTPIITLCTDFGVGDAEIGSLYGVIWSIYPQARVVDLTHGIERHNILQAGLNLSSYTPYFPAGSIHVTVVDPGVGTSRRPMAGQIGEQFYVGPDNGVFTFVIQKAQAGGLAVNLVHLNRGEFWAAQVNPIFHGRDLFAPVAAHLARGVSLAELGAPLVDPVLLEIPQARRHGKGWVGEVIHRDHFGNVGTNITAEQIADLGRVEVFVNGISLGELARTFGERAPGEMVAVLSGSGHVALAVVNGSIVERLGIQIGWRVEVMPLGEKRGEETP